MARFAALSALLLPLIISGSACTVSSPSAAVGVTSVTAPAGDVDVIVRQQLGASAARGRRVLVTVGAPWCEPCVRFHDAVAKGAFDDVLAGVDIVEFNMDVDKDRLAAAGYSSRMIPLMVVPEATGRGGAVRLEGSVKGEAAIADLKGRLQTLLR